MKTIEEFAKYYAGSAMFDHDTEIEAMGECDVESMLEHAVINAILFAEKWISVKDELPQMIEGEITSEYVLVKNENGFCKVSSYCCVLESWSNINPKFGVTHWRPINKNKI